MSTSTIRRSAATLGVVAGLLAAAVPAGAATPTPGTLGQPTAGGAPTTVAAPSQGIIMRDGGICDPIRHMGC